MLISVLTGCTSTKKMKSHAFYFVLRSAFNIFNFVEDRLHLNKKNEKPCFLFCSAFRLHYL